MSEQLMKREEARGIKDRGCKSGDSSEREEGGREGRVLVRKGKRECMRGAKEGGREGGEELGREGKREILKGVAYEAAGSVAS